MTAATTTGGCPDCIACKFFTVPKAESVFKFRQFRHSTLSARNCASMLRQYVECCTRMGYVLLEHLFGKDHHN